MSKLTKLVTIVASAGLMAGGGVLYAQSTGGGAQGTDSGNATGGRGDSGSTTANDPAKQRADGVNSVNSNTTANGSAAGTTDSGMSGTSSGSSNNSATNANTMGSNNSTANDSSLNNSSTGSTAATTAPSTSIDSSNGSTMPAPRADRN